MKIPETISIVMASDNHYAILIAPLLKSIEENHETNEKLEFYVIDDGISNENKAKLQGSIDPLMSKLVFVNPKNVIPTDVKLPIDKTAFPTTTYLRIFSPYIVPKEQTRIIYMDVDMIVLEDISKLWHTDLQGKLFAAVQDHQLTVSCSWGGIPNYKELGIPADTWYFNAGLLLIDTKQWREQEIAVKVLKFINDNLEFVNFADQYGLNSVLYNQWLPLDKRWNWFAPFEHDSPFLIHFLDIKPIFKSYKSVPEFQVKFYEYLNLTQWKGHKPIPHYSRIIKKIITKVKKKSQVYYNLIASPK